VLALQVRAVNTAADSENKIHDDSVAAQYGFRGGLVPGVTVYGYLAEAAIQHFGPAWLDHGAMDVRFHQPVYEGEQVDVTIDRLENNRIRAGIADRAEGVAWLDQTNAPDAPAWPENPIDRRTASEQTIGQGIVLGALSKTLDLAASKMSAPLDSTIHDRAHPAILLALANEILVSNYELGPWIHVSSEVRKFASAKDGDSLQVRARIEEAYERKSHQFLVLDVFIENGRVIEHVRHTAIWRPRVNH
jgi:hypothetical protein